MPDVPSPSPLWGPSRRHVLRFVAGSAGLALLPPGAALMLSGCGGSDATGEPPRQVRNAEEAAALVLAMAQQADRQGTFGVGGALIESDTGRVIHAMHNRVLQPLGAGLGALSHTPFTSDPTAHGERQLVSWYYDNRERLALPAPTALTIVTSLDPCAMCAGALLTAGFNVAVVAYDDFAGVNWRKTADFAGWPGDLGTRLKHALAYCAVEHTRLWMGPAAPVLAHSAVTQASAHACETVFSLNVDKVRAASSASGLDPRDPASGMVNPALSAIRAPYQQAFPAAFSLQLAHYRHPDRALENYLAQLVRETSGARNAVALVDYFGNLLMASADRFDLSPVATAFMTTVQQYSRLRFALVNDPRTSVAAQQALSHPKYGTLVFLHAPDGLDPNTLKDLGAYGSTMEGPLPVTTPSNLQFYRAPLVGTVADLRALVAALPPLYTQLIGIDPQPVSLP